MAEQTDFNDTGEHLNPRQELVSECQPHLHAEQDTTAHRQWISHLLLIKRCIYYEVAVVADNRTSLHLRHAEFAVGRTEGP